MSGQINPKQFSKEFSEECDARIVENSQNSEFKRSSSEWLKLAFNAKYMYNFSVLGRPIIQLPQDVMATHELIWKTKPDLIIETGIAHGGSLISSASILALLDLFEAQEQKQAVDPNTPKRKVVGIDIDIRKHNKALIEEHPLSNRIVMLEGSSTDQAIVDKVGEIASHYSRTMVVLDSHHTKQHVLDELSAYAQFVTKGCYLIVFDTIVNDLPDDVFPDRPWSRSDNPKQAVHEWLQENDNFQIDKSIQNKLLLTAAPDGFLLKTGS